MIHSPASCFFNSKEDCNSDILNPRYIPLYKDDKFFCSKPVFTPFPASFEELQTLPTIKQFSQNKASVHDSSKNLASE